MAIEVTPADRPNTVIRSGRRRTLGWAQTSLIRIGERIGPSKGAILHYFRDKDALVGHLVLEVNTHLAAAVAEAVAIEGSTAGRIRAYIESYMDFIVANPRDITALVELGTAYRHSDGRRLSEIIESAESWPRELLPLDLVGLLADGRRDSQTDDVRTGLIAMIIRGAIDSAAERHARDPDFAPRPYGRKLADVVDSHLFSG